MHIVYYRTSLDGMMIPVPAMASQSTFAPPGEMKVRKNFPETWIWEAVDTG